MTLHRFLLLLLSIVIKLRVKKAPTGQKNLKLFDPLQIRWVTLIIQQRGTHKCKPSSKCSSIVLLNSYKAIANRHANMLHIRDHYDYYRLSK